MRIDTESFLVNVEGDMVFSKVWRMWFGSVQLRTFVTGKSSGSSCPLYVISPGILQVKAENQLRLVLQQLRGKIKFEYPCLC